MSEQRKTRRATLDIYLNKYLAGVPYLAKSSDISSDGMRLERLLEPEQPQRRMGLQFQLPGSEEVIYAEGELVEGYARLQAAGPEAEADGEHRVRFTLLTDRHRKMIREFVEREASGNS